MVEQLGVEGQGPRFSPVRAAPTGAFLSVLSPAESISEERSGGVLFRFESTRAEATVEMSRNAKARLRVASSGSTVRAAVTVAGAAAAAGVEFTPGSSIVRIPLSVDAGPSDDRDAFVLVPVDTAFSSDLMAVMSAKPVLRDFAAQLAAKREPATATIRLVMSVTSELIFFVLVHGSGGGGGSVDALSAAGTPSAQRQRIVREQGILDAAADILRCVSVGHETDAGSDRSRLVDVAQLLHKLLRVSFQECAENELYCARWLPVFLRDACRATAATDVHADRTVKELLETSKRILESAVGASTLEELVDQFTNTRDPRFLTMLGHLCSVGGSAVELNQDIITERLFRGGVDAISFRFAGGHPAASGFVAPAPAGRCQICALKTGTCVHTRTEAAAPGGGEEAKSPDRSNEREVKTPEARVALLQGFVSAGRMIGRRGLPVGKSAENVQTASGAAISSEVEVSCVDFDGGAWVLLEDFLARASASQRGVATAFTDLCAQLCFKRNYNAINVIKPIVPYGLALAVASVQDLPWCLRAAFCRLLRNVYLDADPMTPLRLPILTRVWNDADMRLPCAPAPLIAQFQSMREFIVAYLKGVGNFQIISAAERDHNELTLEVLTLAKLLLQFGCYETASEMRKFLFPMSSILDSVNDAVQQAGGPQSPGKRSSERSSDLRFEMSEDALPVVRCKKMMCEILVVVADIRLDWRVSQFLTAFKRAAQIADAPRGVVANIAAGIVTGISAAASMGVAGITAAASLVVPGANKSGREPVYKLSASELALFKDIFDSDSSESSLDMVSFYDSSSGSADRSPSFVFLDLTRYKDAALVHSAFELLLRSHMQASVMRMLV